VRIRLALVLALLVLAPLVLLTWLGLRFADEAQTASEARLRSVVEARLAELSGVVDGVLDAHAARLDVRALDLPIAASSTVPGTFDLLGNDSEAPQAATAPAVANLDPIAALRAAIQRGPEPAFVLDAEGRRLFPPEPEASSAAERALMERTKGLWDGGLLASRAAADGSSLLNGRGERRPDRGWIGWYVAGGLNLVRWVVRPDGYIVAFELDRVVLLADLVGALPPAPVATRYTRSARGEAEAAPVSGASEPIVERFALLESGGKLAHHWGALAAKLEGALSVTQPLAEPLAAWQLRWDGAPTAEADPTLPLWAGVGAAALALLLLGLWFGREAGRELRRARQRVTFVNQVAHELKTPLTNIRLYAELLEEHLDLDDEDLDDRARRDVGIIVGESQRLSRLIGNILTFAQTTREALTLRPQPDEVDAVVRAAVDQHRPALEAAGVPIQLDLNARGAVQIDADVLGQVVGNLLSNVAKYAPGAAVEVRTSREAERCVLSVHDAGPGVPRVHRGRIFEPFYRVSSANTDRATGTGIGLGLARDLCRLHGGDLVLAPSEAGACFVATLRTPEPTPRTPEPTPRTPEPTPRTPEPTPRTPEPAAPNSSPDPRRPESAT
jgi:signal transduction histidine kinase